MNQTPSPLGHEWATLQHDHEQYEKNSLLIKLVATLFCAIGLAEGLPAALLIPAILIFWLMEGIFRTSQSRLGERLLKVETLLRQNPLPEAAAYQLHSEWQANRPGSLGLILEYLGNAARPTVAFPYPLLLIGAFLS
nr:hypothetical protein [Dechloromonas sp.]